MGKKISSLDWKLKEDFSEVPEQIMTWVRKYAEGVELEEELDGGGDITVHYNFNMCDNITFPSMAHQEGDPFRSYTKKNSLWIDPDKQYSFFLPCTLVKKGTDVSIRKDWNCTDCNKGCPCRPAIAAYYKYLTIYHPERIEEQRAEYFKHKDEIDGTLNNKYPLPELEYGAEELPVIPSERILEIRKSIDNYDFDLSPSDDPSYPLHMIDFRNPKLSSGHSENWSNAALNLFIKNCKNNLVAQTYTKSDTEKLQYLFILKLLENPEEYRKYYARVLSLEEKNDRLSGGSYYGYVAGNDRTEVAETVRNVAENIQLCFGINNTYSKFTAMDLMQTLATVDDMPRYKPMTYTKLEDDVIYLITGLSEFTKAYRSASNDFSDPARRQVEHFISEISEFKLRRFILLAGTEDDIKDFLSLSPSLQIFFNKNKVVIKDKTIDEIYDMFLELIRGKLPEPLPENAKEQFKEYFTFNIGAFPFKNRSLAEYIANYMIQNDCFGFPNDLSGVKRRNFMVDLDQLIGLDNIKKSVKRFYDYARYRTAAKDNGIILKASNMHMVFTGNPGTGKTTVARLIARALYDVGILKENKLIECEKKDLVGEYLGQTAPKTYSVIEKALGGVLFIDEAYSLSSTGNGDSYNEEAVATLVKSMEDKKDNLVIIFAGYKNEMARFIASNPGIASRIGYTFHFDDYTEDELVDMFFLKMNQSKLNVKESCRPLIKDIMRYFHNVENLGNGRFVDKLYQLTLQKKSALSDSDLSSIDENCIPKVEEIIEFLPNNELMILPGAIKDAEKKRVIYHESGHAFVGHLLHAGEEIRRITVEASAGGVLGYVQHRPQAKYLRVQKDYEDSICVLLAGLASEEVFLGSYSDGGSSDLASAMDLARQMVESNGMSELGFAAGYLKDKKDDRRIFEQVDRIFKDQFARAKSIIEENRTAVSSLADILESKRTVDRDEMDELFASISGK